MNSARRRFFNGSVASIMALLFFVSPEQVHAWCVQAYLYSVLGPVVPTDAGEPVVTEFQYDANGNLVKETRNSEINEYNYDVENHLIGAIIRVDQGANAKTVSYQYDADGIRIAKDVTEGATTTQYTYLVDKNRPYAQVIEEHRKEGTDPVELVRYTYGLDLISQWRDTGSQQARYYYHTDGQTSTRELTDTNGDTANTYTNDAFGKAIESSGTVTNAYQYTGEQLDSETGQYYLRARYYQPTTGRFGARDSIDGNRNNPATLHKYGYCGNDPVNCVDPAGRDFTHISLMVTQSLIAFLASILIKAAIGAIIFAALGGVVASYLHIVQTKSFDGLWDAFKTGALQGAVAGLLVGAASAFGTPYLAAALIGLLGYNIAASIEVLMDPAIRPETKVAIVLLLILQVILTKTAIARAGSARTYSVSMSAEQATGAGRLTINQLLPEVPDDAYLHLTPAKANAFRGGVGRGTFWVRKADVGSYLLDHYKSGVVGPMAQGSQPEALTFVVYEGPDSAFSAYPSANPLKVPEYRNTEVITPTKIIDLAPPE